MSPFHHKLNPEGRFNLGNKQKIAERRKYGQKLEKKKEKKFMEKSFTFSNQLSINIVRVVKER